MTKESESCRAFGDWSCWDIKMGRGLNDVSGPGWKKIIDGKSYCYSGLANKFWYYREKWKEGEIEFFFLLQKISIDEKYKELLASHYASENWEYTSRLIKFFSHQFSLDLDMLLDFCYI